MYILFRFRLNWSVFILLYKISQKFLIISTLKQLLKNIKFFTSDYLQLVCPWIQESLPDGRWTHDVPACVLIFMFVLVSELRAVRLIYDIVD